MSSPHGPSLDHRPAWLSPGHAGSERPQRRHSSRRKDGICGPVLDVAFAESTMKTDGSLGRSSPPPKDSSLSQVPPDGAGALNSGALPSRARNVVTKPIASSAKPAVLTSARATRGGWGCPQREQRRPRFTLASQFRHRYACITWSIGRYVGCFRLRYDLRRTAEVAGLARQSCEPTGLFQPFSARRPRSPGTASASRSAVRTGGRLRRTGRHTRSAIAPARAASPAC